MLCRRRGGSRDRAGAADGPGGGGGGGGPGGGEEAADGGGWTDELSARPGQQRIVSSPGRMDTVVTSHVTEGGRGTAPDGRTQ